MEHHKSDIEGQEYQINRYQWFSLKPNQENVGSVSKSRKWNTTNQILKAKNIKLIDINGLASSQIKKMSDRCRSQDSDQGSQFTSPRFTAPLLAHGIQISMDGRGRALDNIFVERLWRTVKYEYVYLQDWSTLQDARSGLAYFFARYNHRRLHQSLGYQTPASVYFRARAAA